MIDRLKKFTNPHPWMYLGTWLCLIVPVLYFHRGLLRGELPIGGDLVSQFVPWRRFALNEIAAGRFPWWNPYVFCGTPFAANIQTSLFYPFNLLHLLVSSPERFFACSIIFHHILAGCTLWIWRRSAQKVRREPDSPIECWAFLGPLVSALVWQWSAFLICHTHDGHLIHLRACAWMPLVFWGQDRLRRKPSVPILLACALPFSMMVLGGHVQIPLYTGYLVVLRALILGWEGQTIQERWKHTVKTVGGTAGMLAVTAGLLAVVLLPLQELSSHSSTRAGGASYELATSDSLPLTHLPTLLAPFFYGHPLDPFPTKKYWGGYTGFHELAGYAGILTICLIPFAFSRWNSGPKHVRREHWMWLALMGLGLLGALGTIGLVHPLAYYGLPGYSYFRVPARLLLIVILGEAVLAGEGFEALNCLRRSANQNKRALWTYFMPSAIVLISCIAVLGILWFASTPIMTHLKQLEIERTLNELQLPETDAPKIAKELPNILFTDRFMVMVQAVSLTLGWTSLSLLWMAAVLFLPTFGKSRINALGAWLGILIMLADGLWFSNRFAGSAPPETYEKMNAFDIPALSKYVYPSREGRILILDDIILTRDELKEHPGLKPNRMMNYGLETVRGYDPIILDDMARLTNMAQDRSEDFVQGGMLRYGAVERLHPKALAVLDVGVIVCRQPVGGWETIWSGDSGQLVVLRNPYPHQRVWLIRDGKIELNDDTQVMDIQEKPGWLSTRVQVNHRPALLVWSQIRYPGWTATINGIEAEVGSYAEALLAVEIPVGEHQVEFQFKPVTFQRGAIVTVCMLLGLGIVYLLERRRG